jgi:amphi-Trp domain-containing protein
MMPRPDSDMPVPASVVPASVVPENTERARDKIKFKQTLGREELAVYLEAIVKGLRKGQIEFRRGGETVSINPAPSIELAVKAAEKSRGGKLTLELAWAQEEGA